MTLICTLCPDTYTSDKHAYLVLTHAHSIFFYTYFSDAHHTHAHADFSDTHTLRTHAHLTFSPVRHSITHAYLALTHARCSADFSDTNTSHAHTRTLHLLSCILQRHAYRPHTRTRILSHRLLGNEHFARTRTHTSSSFLHTSETRIPPPHTHTYSLPQTSRTRTHLVTTLSRTCCARR